MANNNFPLLSPDQFDVLTENGIQDTGEPFIESYVRLLNQHLAAYENTNDVLLKEIILERWEEILDSIREDIVEAQNL